MAETAVRKPTRKKPAKTAGTTLSPQQVSAILKKIKDKPLPRKSNSVEELHACHESHRASTDRAYEILGHDPGYALALFAEANRELTRLERETAATLEHVIVVLGMPRVIQIGQGLPKFEELERDQQLLLKQVFSLCHHAGVQARELTALRGSSATDAAFFAAQMRELFLAHLELYAPNVLEGRDGLSFGAPDAQDAIQSLAAKLASYWHLPPLVQESFEATPSAPALVVRNASRIVHLSEMGWYHALMLKTLQDTSDQLQMDSSKLIKCVHQASITAVHETAAYQVPHPAARLLEPVPQEGLVSPAPMPPIVVKKQPAKKTPPPEDAIKQKRKSVSNSPSKTTLEKKAAPKSSATQTQIDVVEQLKEMGRKKRPAQEILKYAIESIVGAFSGHPLVFFLMDKQHKLLRSRFVSGLPDVKQPITIPLDQKHLFQLLTNKSQAAFINKRNREKYLRVLSADLPLAIDKVEFFAMSLIIQDKPFGLFYVEAKQDTPLDTAAYQEFVAICKATTFALEKVKSHA